MNEDEKIASKFINNLEEISYSDWIKIRTAIDRSFKFQISEMEKKIKLTNPEEIEKLIQSQFG